MSFYPVYSSLAAGVPFIFPNPTAPEYPDPKARDIAGFNAIITGANSGIGQAITKELVRRGANVTMACRSAERAEKARADILNQLEEARGSYNNKAFARADAEKRISIAALDTDSLASVREFAKTYLEDDSRKGKIDLFYCNAGIAAVSAKKNTVNDDGFETIYATNFLSHFLLVNLLEPRLAEDARIISTASLAGCLASFSKTFSTAAVKNEVEPGFHVRPGARASPKGSHDSAYNQSKAMQTIFTRALNERALAQGSRRIAFSFHPGLISTSIFAAVKDTGRFGLLNVIAFFERLFGLSPDASAYTPILFATATEAALGKRETWSQLWERSRPFYTYIDEQKTARFWERWCNDVGVAQDWAI
ncbi:hypothetical protein V8E36_008449 [Tilletia maclaganii]